MKKVFLLFFCALVFSCTKLDNEPPKSGLTIGDNVIIQTVNDKPIAAAKSRESLDKLVKAMMSSDDDRYNVLLRSGEIFIISSKTAAKITDRKDIAFEIKIIDGEYKDYYVWVGGDWLKPLNK